MAKEIYKLSVEPITCVHIGSGEKLTPLEYIVHNSKQYIVYDSDVVLSRIANDKKKFSEFDNASSSNDMKKLIQISNDEFLPNGDVKNLRYEDIKYLCGVTKEFATVYANKIKGDPIKNGMFVEQMYRPQGKATPVIPGSSLKGAMRTAVLNGLIADLPDSEYYDQLKIFGQKKDKKEFENSLQNILLKKNNAKDDPFRAVEVGDCTFAGKGTQIVGLLKNIKKDRDGEIYEHNSSQIQAEVLKGKMCSVTDIGSCVVRFNNDLGLRKEITPKEIIDYCNYFYMREFKNEYAFYENAIGGNIKSIKVLYDELNSIVNSDLDTFILRVGRWSQVEFVTFEENFRAPKNKKFGTTRTVFNYDGDYLPLGWCKCTLTKAGE